MRKLLLVALAVFLPSIAYAQTTPTLEITPFAGYRWGGTINGRDSDFFPHDVDVRESSAYGLTVNVPITGFIQLELMADRQQSNLTYSEKLFGGSTNIADIDITYYHAGVLWQWDSSPMVHPYFAVGGGIATLDLKAPGASSETRASGSVAGGVKVMLNRNVGVRLEGRGYWTDTSGGEDHYWGENNDLTQGEVRIGLVLSF